MEMLQKRNPLIFVINLMRLILVIGSAAVLLIIQKVQPDIITRPQKLLYVFIVALLYSLIVLIAPFSKIKNKFLGYFFCTIDSLLILGLIYCTGEIASPFFILFFFPLISLSFLYEILGSFYAAIIFTIYTIFFITTRSYSDSKLIANIFISMGILVMFSLYLGNIGKQIKARKRIKELEEEVKTLKLKLENKK
ncbi:MAG TPA: hypothetical protein PLM75_05075 [bacterium]|nr:hypothetical protein [bacterium]